jgi:hypothetical protein
VCESLTAAAARTIFSNPLQAVATRTVDFPQSPKLEALGKIHCSGGDGLHRFCEQQQQQERKQHQKQQLREMKKVVSKNRFTSFGSS